jgi:hypothetical protein
MKAGPKQVSCYICGRDFGTTSYHIHYKQCQKKFTDEQKLVDKSERKKIPDAPPGLDDILEKKKLTAKQYEEYNTAALDIWNSKSLSKCDGCGRTFKPESLKIHIKSCKGAKASDKGGSTASGSHLGDAMGGGMGGGMNGSTGGSAKRKSSKSPNRGPKTLQCFICGKGFMQRSIRIHVTQCKDKYKKESINLGVKRKLPIEPEELEELIAMDTMSMELLDEYNKKAAASYNDGGLMKCPN